MSEGKIINHGFETQAEIIEGVKKSVEAIKKTLGPSGKAVCISGFTGPEVSRDGATVAKSISFKNQLQNTGAIFVKNAAAQTERLAGDGTSSTSLLIKEMCEKGQKALRTGANVNEVKSGMLKAGKWMAEYIKNNSIPVNDDMEKIRKVATISANNDPAIGNLVVECMEKVGMLGIITADFSSGLETTIDVTTGMKLDRGWASPQYVTNPTDGTCVMEDPYVIVVGERLSSVQQILPLMEQLVPTGRPFLFIVDDIDEVVNTTLVMNTLQGAIRCCVVKGIDFGDSRKNIMADISDLIPAGVGMILFTIISFVTLSTLMYQKNMKKYSIYYVQGLTWKRIFRIHILYISLIILTALVLGILMSLAAGHFGIWSGLAVQLGGVQITGCLIITILLLASSALMCLSLVKGRSAKEILQGGEI